MNKKILVLSAALLTILSSTVMAQDSVIYLDVRPNDNAATIRTITGNLGSAATNPFLNDTVNGGRRGQGQILYLEPKANDGWESVNSAQKSGLSFPNFDGDLNHATGDLWIYMDVNDDASGVGDVISSVGLDIDTRQVGATMRNKIAAMAVTMDNTNAVFNSITPVGGSPWNNKVDGAQVLASDPPDWEKAKAVRVPVEDSGGPVYNASLGIQPRAQGTTPSYRLGRIALTAGTRSCLGRIAPDFTNNSSYDIYLEVNNLLITRAYNGAGDTVENVSFGYSALTGGAVPELPAVSGNTDGAVSAVADGRVQIRLKGDFTGDGNVTSADSSAFVAAAGDATDNQLASYLGDFNGNNTVTSADSGSSGAGGAFYLHSLTRSGIASCP